MATPNLLCPGVDKVRSHVLSMEISRLHPFPFLTEYSVVKFGTTELYTH